MVNLRMSSYKVIKVILVILLLMLTMRIMHGDGSIAEIMRLRTAIKQQQTILAELKASNDDLLVEIEYLKNKPLALEEQARYELGMIKQGETYFQVVEPVE